MIGPGTVWQRTDHELVGRVLAEKRRRMFEHHDSDGFRIADREMTRGRRA